MNNLTRQEIADKIYGQTGYPRKQIVATVQLTLDTIVHALARCRNVELRNIGVFEVQKRKARVGRNPKQPEINVPIPAQAVVKFKSGKALQHLLSKLDLAKL